MALDVVYEDAALVVVNKPAGLSVHPGPGHPDGTLVNGLLAHIPDLGGIGGELRPGIVHRLDKDTSGLLVVAKTAQAHATLVEAFAEREVAKTYLAIVRGRPELGEGMIDAPLARDPVHRQRMAIVEGGRPARTAFRVVAEGGGWSLVEARPETGRTHQIRVHMASIGHPIVGDALYGRREEGVARQMLHAWRLSFRHPTSGEEMRLEAALPVDFGEALRRMGIDAVGALTGPARGPG
jgi:23S rRNA pseudouridine1911/1915/1917 synthase